MHGHPAGQAAAGKAVAGRESALEDLGLMKKKIRDKRRGNLGLRKKNLEIQEKEKPEIRKVNIKFEKIKIRQTFWKAYW